MGLIKLNNSGDKILDDIFNDVITVYEDVMGSKLLVRWDGENFEFRTKSINNDPISLVDLSLQKYYNKAINFFFQLDKHVLSLLPKNFHFCFEYFPDNQPAHIEYNKSPKNNLILTGIVKGNKFEYSIEEILEFSNLFNCDPLPVIFYGKLNQKQKEGIKYFLHTSEQDLEYIFGDENFAYFFYKLLDPTHKHSFLMEEGEYQPNVQRLIIRTNENDYRYELLNPLYTKTVESIETNFTEVYTLIILNFLNYIQNISLENLKLSGKSYDETYINIICKLYNMYLNDNSEELDEFKFDIPKFFNKDKFKINIELIKNQLTTKYIKKNDRFEYIFKCVLGSFNNKKKKPVGIFTENSLLLFNNYIDNIDDIITLHLNKVKEDKLRNSNLMNFGDYYDFNYDVDGAEKVYPDVYTEFEVPTDDKKKKKGFKK
jgi:hypothetical protein